VPGPWSVERQEISKVRSFDTLYALTAASIWNRNVGENIVSGKSLLHRLSAAHFAKLGEHLAHLSIKVEGIISLKENIHGDMKNLLPLRDHLLEQSFEILKLGRALDVGDATPFARDHGIGNASLGLEAFDFLCLIWNMHGNEDARPKREFAQHRSHAAISLVGQNLPGKPVKPLIKDI
jgi:hypothetical protein